MKLDFLQEPELEFGTGKHIDIRFGLMHHGPLDRFSSLAPGRIRLGIVGTPETVEGVQAWLERCRNGVAAKKSNQPNLFPQFPGFGDDTNLQAALITDSQLQKTIRQQEFDKLCKTRETNQVINEAVEMFMAELQRLTEKGIADALMCAVPMNFVKFMAEEGTDKNEEGTEKEKSWTFITC